MLYQLFKRKKPEVNEIDLPILEQIKTLRARMTRLEAEILDVATAQDIIRNKVLRKIQVKKEEEEPDSDNWNGIPKGKL